jgi:hypothetical protein
LPSFFETFWESASRSRSSSCTNARAGDLNRAARRSCCDRTRRACCELALTLVLAARARSSVNCRTKRSSLLPSQCARRSGAGVAQDFASETRARSYAARFRTRRARRDRFP